MNQRANREEDWSGVTVSADGAMLFGGDYNYEQWPESTWDGDMDLFAEAGINELTLNVFGWVGLQPSEDAYDFGHLDRVIDCAERHGMAIELATATAALPAWLSERFEEVNRVDFEGRRQSYGKRHNACPNSPVFRGFAERLVDRLAERYGRRRSIVAWHVSNEYENLCYCPNCAAAFRVWLKNRYGTVEALNEAWTSAFWSHTFASFDQIVPPNRLGDAFDENLSVLPAAFLDYARFFGESQLSEFVMEKNAIRRHDPSTPVTTNFFGRAARYDYAKWADDLDVVSWDCYVGLQDSLDDTSFWHAMMRGLKHGQPFMLMEQSPAKQCWFNPVQLSGQMRRQSYQALAHGADIVQFFQLKRSRGGCEQFHGAVVGLDESDRPRTFREVRALGEELQRIGREILGTRIRSRVAVMFDWESRWAMNDADGHAHINDYYDAVREYYAGLRQAGLSVDVITPSDDLAGYDLVVAPYLYIVSQQTADRFRAYVRAGGRLVVTVMSGLAEPPDRLYLGEAPVPFRDLTGIWSEELDVLAEPYGTIPVIVDEAMLPASAREACRKADGLTGRTLCDIIHADPDVRVLGVYGGDSFYAGMPALTEHRFGEGSCYYVATKPGAGLMAMLVDAATDGLELERRILPRDVESTTRVSPNGDSYTFLISGRTDDVNVACPADATELITQRRVRAGEPLTLHPFDAMILKQGGRRLRRIRLIIAPPAPSRASPRDGTRIQPRRHNPQHHNPQHHNDVFTGKEQQ